MTVARTNAAALGAAVLLVLFVCITLVGSATLGAMHVDPDWIGQYLTALGTIAALELGDGTQIFCAASTIAAYKEERISGVLKVLAGVFLASLLVPWVGIAVASALAGIGVTEMYLRLFACIVFIICAVMAWMGARGGDEAAWKERLQELFSNFGVFVRVVILFFVFEVPDKTGIGSGALQLSGMTKSANAIGSSIALIDVNFATVAVILLVGAFRERWVQWFGYFAAAGFACGGIYMACTFILSILKG